MDAYESRRGPKPERRKSLEDRFWSKVDKSGECWLWTGRLGTKGYGTIRPGGTTNSRPAHVVSLEMALGRPLAPGMQANHHCDVRACVRPEHLYEGTQKDNIHDMHRRGRWVNGKQRQLACKYGHPFTPENTGTSIGRNGKTDRWCRECKRQRTRIWKAQRFVQDF